MIPIRTRYQERSKSNLLDRKPASCLDSEIQYRVRGKQPYESTANQTVFEFSGRRLTARNSCSTPAAFPVPNGNPVNRLARCPAGLLTFEALPAHWRRD